MTTVTTTKNDCAPDSGTSRREQLRQWLGQRGVRSARLDSLAGDASPRHYCRVHSDQGERTILMDAAGEPQSLRAFIAACADLRRGGLRVPKLLAYDSADSLLWLEDVGEHTMFDHLNALRDSASIPVASAADDPVIVLYRRAIDELVSVCTLPSQHLPSFDHRLLTEEMNLFRDWFLTYELGESQFDDNWRRGWSELHQSLIGNTGAVEQVWVHRDFHSRNLMIDDDDPRPVLLDFQDAVRGSICYDLVSLLRDYYFPLTDIQFDFLRFHFRSLVAPLRRLPREQYIRHFDLLAAQRHLKVIGIFSRLKHRDGKAAYLKDIPQAWDYLRQISPRYQELSWLDAQINREPVRLWMAKTRQQG